MGTLQPIWKGVYNVCSPLAHQRETIHSCPSCAYVLVELWCRDHGPRLDRQKTRLMWLVEDWGVDKFREAIGERMGVKLREGVHEQVRLCRHTQCLPC